MNAKLLQDSVEVLKDLRSELHGKAEDDVLETLDKVITDLEKVLEENPSKISTDDVLKIIGSVIEKLPAIVELIRYLSTL